MARSRTGTGALAGPPALKERAGVVAALLDGRQTVLVRAPDLPPDGTDGPFALYPSFSHQDPERYGQADERYYHRSTTKPADGIPLREIAEVVAERSVPAGDLAALAPHYVYTPAGLREKYGLDDGDAARVLLVRVSALADPRVIAERPAYRGCRTWIALADEVTVDAGAATPVLDDAAFARRRAAIEAL